MEKDFPKKNNLSLAKVSLKAVQIFIALGIFARIASMIVPNFKNDYVQRIQSGIFKFGMHVEENALQKTDTTYVCMTSDFSISE